MVPMWWRGGGALRAGCAAPLLAQVNLLLALYGGASLATAARLKWDPSTYIAVRELFPAEYCTAAVVITVAGSLLLLLPQIAAAALHASKPSNARLLLCIYAAAMSLLMVAELVFGAWLVRRMLQFLASDTALFLLEARRVHRLLRPSFSFVSVLHPVPRHITNLINEAEQDAPRNLYVMAGAATLLALLQLLAVPLALLLACTRGEGAAPVQRAHSGPQALGDSQRGSSGVGKLARIFEIPARALQPPFTKPSPPLSQYKEMK